MGSQYFIKVTDVCEDSKIRDVMRGVERHTGVPLSKVLLTGVASTMDGNVMQGHLTLKECGIKPGHTFFQKYVTGFW